MIIIEPDVHVRNFTQSERKISRFRRLLKIGATEKYRSEIAFWSLVFFFLRFHLFIFRERGREGGR